MVSGVLLVLGFVLSATGFILTIIICVLPMWKVTAVLQHLPTTNKITLQFFNQGLWKTCDICQVHDSPLGLSQEFLVGRVMVVIAIVFSFLGILLGVASSKTTCGLNKSTKAKVCNAAGIMIISGVLCLISVCWIKESIVKDFNKPSVLNNQITAVGRSIHIGWGASGLLILGGGFLCSNCPKDNYSGNAMYKAAGGDIYV